MLSRMSISKLRRVLLTIKNPWQLKVLRFLKRKAQGSSGVLEDDFVASIIKLLDRLLPRFPYVHKVIINGKAIDKVSEAGKMLQKKYLVSRTVHRK